jgi:hypothetical protein
MPKEIFNKSYLAIVYNRNNFRFEKAENYLVFFN